jgi:uncharacterized protein (TIGR02271 family)
MSGMQGTGRRKPEQKPARNAMSRVSDANRPPEQSDERVIPLLAEELEVSKHRVETGRVQVARITHEREQLIDELLAREIAEIERVRIDEQVDTMPAVREEGDAIVIPIVEEVLVVERRLFLKEEVRVRRVRSTVRHQESVTLRHHEAVVTRTPTEAPEAGQKSESGEEVRKS